MANGNQLWRTRDSRKNWELIFENSNDFVPEEFAKGDFANIDAILFQNSKVGWIADTSNLYKTQDGGFTWEKDEFWTTKLDKGYITKIYQSEDGTIFVIGATHQKLSKPVAARDEYKAFVFFQKGKNKMARRRCSIRCLSIWRN